MNSLNLLRAFRLLLALAAVSTAWAQGTTFTYQGQLRENGVPADGVYDLRFTLHDAASGGAQYGPVLSHPALAIRNGLFSVVLDFGSGAFTNSSRWIEVAVRTNGVGSFSVLSPRQAVTAAPLALYALTPAGPQGPVGPQGPAGAAPFSLVGTNAVFLTGFVGLGTTNPATTLDVVGTVTARNFAGNASGLTALPAAQLSGTVPSAGLGGIYGGAVSFTNAANQFTGNGANLSGLSASQLAAGTVPDARLAGNVARTNRVWLLGGNAGTVSGTDFLGTTDPRPLELRVNNLTGLRLEPGPGGELPNLVGGTNNVDAGWESVILSGRWNTIQSNVFAGFIGGGWYNSLQRTAIYSAIVQGYNNSIQTNAQGSFIGSGMHNVVQPDALTAVIAGGYANTSGAPYAVVPGGSRNAALGTNSLAAGQRAKARHEGSFVWADFQNTDFASTGPNQFLIRASQGVGINTNAPQAALHVAGSVMASNFVGSAAGLTNLNGAALVPASVAASAITPGTLKVADLDDGGAAAYADRMAIARSLSSVEPLPFTALSLVVSNTAAPPSFVFLLGGVEYGTVVAFSGQEALSELYEYVVEVLAPRPDLVPADQLGRQASLRFVRNGRTTRFEGLVTACSVASSDSGNALVTFRLESPLAYLALSTDYRIYQNQPVPDVVASLYQTVTSNVLSRSLTGTYPPRENVVQFGETDLNFFSRLLEDQGIFYFFNAEGVNPILGDGPAAYLAAPHSPFRYYGNTATNTPAGAEFIRTFQKATRESTLRATLRSYDFKTPAADLTALSSSPLGGRGDRYEYGTSGTTLSENSQLAKSRMERYEVERVTLDGSGNAPDLRPGYTFALDDRTDAALTGDYLVTAVRHGAFRRITNGVVSLFYGSQFEVIPATALFHPAPKTPRPTANASLAKVTGPAGEEIHVDQHGRVKVQFRWDRRGTNDQNSSAWIRCASPWAGASWGALFLPRVGHEVLVEFLEGNPDQPVVTGGLYNAANTPPYSLPANKTRSTLKTRSTPGGASGEGNEIRFEDLKGSEELYLHAQKDLNLDANNDAALDVGRDLAASVVRDLSLDVGNAMTFSASSLTLSLSQGVGIGTTHDPAYALKVNGAVSAGGLTLGGPARLGDYDLFLRGGTDTYHGLGWYGTGKLFAGVNVNGPALYGNGGGVLGSVGGLTNIALSWDNSGNVAIGAQLRMNTNVVMNDKDVLLRGDLNHGVGWYGIGKSFAGASPDGPVLYGYSGGGLGTVRSGSATNLALFWNNTGNVGIGTTSPTQKLYVAGNIYATGTITPNSDRNLKTDFTAVDTAAVLDKVTALPIQQWRFTNESHTVKHVGPMAQDFHAAFGLGALPTAIATVDADGVALAAIQALNRKVEQQRTENAALRRELEALQETVRHLAQERNQGTP